MSHSGAVPHSFDVEKFLSSLHEVGDRVIHGLGAIPSPSDLQNSLRSLMQHLIQEPAQLAALQQQFVAEQQRLMQSLSPVQTDAAVAEPQSHTLGPSAKDKRFSGKAWQEAPQFRYLAESYLAASRILLECVDDFPLESHAKSRLRFFVKQYVDAVAPSNFLMTNPEAVKSAIESQGSTLRAGLENLQSDVESGHISMTDESAFEVGKNIVLTVGSVVFENEIFQLIQYKPTTEKVHAKPIVLVPPCINKYYILDLTPENSLVKFLVEQGLTVFIVSWRNVQAEQGHLRWDDYIRDGVIKAIDVVRVITNVDKINALGFCVGGTILGCSLAVLRRLGHDVVESVTFLTTFLDFTEAGDITAYIDQEFVERNERDIGGGGIINGGELSSAFSSLRANDLVWNYVVNNYLKGTKPPAFDLLFWNSDSTNLPGPWYSYYLRNTYLENNLIKPDRLTMCGVPVDLSFIDMPAFVFGAKEDHIVPWRAAFSSAGFLTGPTEFVLGASGHIAGVVNPAGKNKRSYWHGGDVTQKPDNWLESATEVPGSWWRPWMNWLKPRSGKLIPARTLLGNAEFRPIEPAPGRYVKAKAKEKTKGDSV